MPKGKMITVMLDEDAKEFTKDAVMNAILQLKGVASVCHVNKSVINGLPQMTYLLNAVGEETGNADIPKDVISWYNKVIMDSEWNQYLVKFQDDYGILAVLEISHPKQDDWQDVKEFYSEKWAKSTPEEILNKINGYGEGILENIPFDVYLGNQTGIDGRHELCIFFPFESTRREIEIAFLRTKCVDIEF